MKILYWIFCPFFFVMVFIIICCTSPILFVRLVREQRKLKRDNALYNPYWFRELSMEQMKELQIKRAERINHG